MIVLKLTYLMNKKNVQCNTRLGCFKCYISKLYVCFEYISLKFVCLLVMLCLDISTYYCKINISNIEIFMVQTKEKLTFC